MPLNADQRGELAPNGKPSLTVDEAAANLVRDGYTWAFAPASATTLTYAFRLAQPGSMPSDTAGFSAFTPAQVAAAERALLAWSDVAGIVFQRAADGDDATMLFGNYNTGEEDAAAFAYYPGSRSSGSLAGDVWVDITVSGNTDLGRGGQGDYILVHEIGHAIGLAHPGAYSAEDNATYASSATYYEDTRVYTVMSYFGSINTGTTTAIFANAPQLDDIAAVQALYGANFATRADDTVYGFNSNTARSWYTLESATDAMYVSVWDGGGVDTLDFSGYGQNQRIDLRQGAFSDVGPNIGSVTIAMGAVIENAIGGSGDDTITGNASDNLLTGALGRDFLIGAEGLDSLYGGGGDDVMAGGEGSDTLWADVGLDRVYGDAGADLLSGGADADELWGGTGDDRLYGDSGRDLLVGEGGADTLWAGLDDDRVYGSAGADLLVGEGGDDQLWGGEDADRLYGSEGLDLLVGEGGDDQAFGGADADLMLGFGGVDDLYGEGGNDRLYGDQDGDLLVGQSGADELWGGIGSDRLYGSEDVDLLVGEDGADELWGGSGADRLYGSGGADLLVGEEGDDELWGGPDADNQYGGAGRDLIVGEDGDDGLFGGEDADNLFGGAGADLLVGEAGADRLTGQGGNDRLFGGAGADVFIFDGVSGADTVTDFDRAAGDRFTVEGGRFTGLATGDFNGDGLIDTRLDHAGGTVVVLGVGDLTLDGWNGLVI